MARPRLLDLFCGAGGCSVGYHRAGFDVVGVDKAPQKNFPFKFVEADAVDVLVTFLQCGSFKSLRLREFDVIHASPPCQRYSVSTAPHGDSGREKHPDLLEPIRSLLEQCGKIWVIENVMGAPMKPPTIMLCGMMFGLRVLRHRLFESNVLLFSPEHPTHPAGKLTNSHRSYDRGERPFVCLAGHNFERREGEKAMGIDWMKSRRELAQSIPPAYTEFVGRQLMTFISPASETF
jgi:DNA (cytosine-5)-methyltransferase 1